MEKQRVILVAWWVWLAMGIAMAAWLSFVVAAVIPGRIAEKSAKLYDRGRAMAADAKEMAAVRARIASRNSFFIGLDTDDFGFMAEEREYKPTENSELRRINGKYRWVEKHRGKPSQITLGRATNGVTTGVWTVGNE